MIFSEHRKTPVGFSDLVNYAALIEDGILLLKDGALMRSWYYEGPDLDSASDEELTSLSAQVNSILSQLGNGWMLHADAIRRPAADYPLGSEFPHPTLELRVEERRANYVDSAEHFESVYALTLTYLSALEMRLVQDWHLLESIYC